MKRWIHASKDNDQKYSVIIDFNHDGVLDEDTEDIIRDEVQDVAEQIGAYIYKEDCFSKNKNASQIKLVTKDGIDETRFEQRVNRVMKRNGCELESVEVYVGASTEVTAKRDIEKKIRDYIATWAKDDAKNGEPVATYREFEDEMKEEGLKADRNGYDYYITCYNGACK